MWGACRQICVLWGEWQLHHAVEQQPVGRGHQPGQPQPVEDGEQLADQGLQMWILKAQLQQAGQPRGECGWKWQVRSGVCPLHQVTRELTMLCYQNLCLELLIVRPFPWSVNSAWSRRNPRKLRIGLVKMGALTQLLALQTPSTCRVATEPRHWCRWWTSLDNWKVGRVYMEEQVDAVFWMVGLVLRLTCVDSTLKLFYDNRANMQWVDSFFAPNGQGQGNGSDWGGSGGRGGERGMME